MDYIRVNQNNKFAEIVVLKGFKILLNGMRCVDLYNEVLKISVILSSYNKKIQQEEKFVNILLK